jgi:acyl-CoA thioesterase-1
VVDEVGDSLIIYCRAGLATMLVILSVFFGQPGHAAPVTIVALGTSNTYGHRVGRNETYPVKLQAALKARGIDARVINAGINGDTAKGILARVSKSVPNGTRLVLIEIHANNEVRGGVADQTAANTAAIKSNLQARNIPYLDVSATMAGTFRGAPRASDGRHLGPGGYDMFVSSIVSLVASALSR